MKRLVLLVLIGVFLFVACETLMMVSGKREVVVEIFADTERFFVSVKTEKDNKYSNIMPFNEVMIISKGRIGKEEPVILRKDVVEFENLCVKMWPVSGRVLVEDGGRWKRVERLEEGEERVFSLEELSEKGALEVIETERRAWVIIRLGKVLE